MNYSKIVRKLREKLLLSQQEFANEIGVSFATVNRWENGKHQPTYKAKRIISELCKKNKINLGD